MRLLVACQDSGIYIFETGQGSMGTASKEIPCQDLLMGTQEAEGAVNEPDASAWQREVRQTPQIRQTRSHGVPGGRGGVDHICGR